MRLVENKCGAASLLFIVSLLFASVNTFLSTSRLPRTSNLSEIPLYRETATRKCYMNSLELMESDNFFNFDNIHRLGNPFFH